MCNEWTSQTNTGLQDSRTQGRSRNDGQANVILGTKRDKQSIALKTDFTSAFFLFLVVNQLRLTTTSVKALLFSDIRNACSSLCTPLQIDLEWHNVKVAAPCVGKDHWANV